MKERFYYLSFSLVNGIGPKRFENLLKHFKTAEKAWQSNPEKLKELGFSDFVIKNFEKTKETLDIRFYIQKLKVKKVSFIALCDEGYPELLKTIPNPPIVLFIKGNIKAVGFKKTIGIVGTRKITNYGREVTDIFSKELSLSGFTVVSGLAMGVDSQAAQSAIEAGGRTIAVLGNGVDICVPSTNEGLYDRILDGYGIIVSEFPLGFSPTKGSFPSRNRIIAGLSLGVLVTEGAKDSGSLITADWAFKYKRKVFAVPGPITSYLSVAPLKLIERGAKLVTSANDICKELKIQSPELKVKRQKIRVQNVTKEERQILELLENESLHFDEIVRRLKFEPSLIGSTLSILEVKGIVESFEGGFYRLSKYESY